ncbi:amino acid adenylation domain-containing protein [Paenibacillus sp. PR3]|uniref:Amino acid adenylation domain-containing protein n=1 Tax=Paenibacillus terricola TaxID=2763503 RepID=A0ABR8MVW2_9BACL|nr:non-ribosomal peptide synthetase [Paenibacillus terricola]MBD3919132.1 amino acid adenylation domain-containing protein [Paenibacillus terricola]
MKYADLSQVIQDKRMSEHGITFLAKHEEVYFSYKELLDKALGVLYILQAKGLAAGDELIFQLEDNYDFIRFFWACLLGGFIPVPVTVGNNKEYKAKLLGIFEILERPFLVTTREIMDGIESYCVEENKQKAWESLHSAVILAEDVDDSLGIGRIHSVQSQDIAMIQFSSGSTGNPKGVILTHSNIIHNAYAILSGGRVTQKDSSLSWMPLTHDMGLIGSHLTSLLADINLYLMPPALFIFEPGLWLQKTNEHRITLLSSPNFGYKHFLEHFKRVKAEQWNLSSVRLIFNGAEPVSASWSRRFIQELKPYGLGENVMFPVYGMAEASLAVTFPPIGEALIPVHLDRRSMHAGMAVKEADPSEIECITFVDVGSPVEHCEVRICNDDGLVLPEWRVGNIQIKGKNITKGYYNEPKATKKLITDDGWLHTGDLGFIRNQRLVVTGRKKDIIFVRGQNYYPHDLEEAAQRLDGIELGKVAVCGVPSGETGMDEIIVFVVFRGKTEKFVDVAMRLKKWLNKSLGLDILHVLPVKSIPKTTSGKLQRFKLSQSYENGDFKNVITELAALLEQSKQVQAEVLPETLLERQMARLWCEVLGRQHIGVTEDFFELGGDSLKAALLLNQLHKEFDVHIPVKQLFSLSTIQKLAVYMQHIEAQPFEPIGRAEPKEAYPVSPSQFRVYVQEQFAGIGTSYNIPFVIHMNGVPDPLVIRRALEKLLQRHTILRTSFVEIEGEVMQRVHDHVELPFEVIHCEAAELHSSIERFIRPFDLHQPPLFRTGLFSCNVDAHHLVIDIHHTISDGVSIQIIMEQLMSLMQGIETEQPELQYVDYTVWQKRQLSSETITQHRDYWRSQLSGELPVLELPTDHKRGELRSFRGRTIPFSIKQDTVQSLQHLARQNQVSLNAVMISLYAFVLSKYTQQDELMVGSLVSGRNHADLASMLGMFINYIPLRIQIKTQNEFTNYLRNCGRIIEEAYEHQDYPYENMIADASAKTLNGRNPLFDTMLIMHNQMDIAQKRKLGDLELTFEEWKTNTAKLDLKLDIYAAHSEGLHCVLEYNADLFEHSTMERFAAHFCNVVNQISENQQIHLYDISILSEQERAQLLLEFNDTSCDFPEDALLHHWIEEQARLNPSRTAVYFKDIRLTYSELNTKANQLARILRMRGLGPNQIAAVIMERSVEMMIGLLAVLKAGGAYLPISPNFPLERIQYMLEDSEVSLLLSQRRWEGRLTAGDAPEAVLSMRDSACIFYLDDEMLYSAPADNEVSPAAPKDLAYVIYTSGSTGMPKGVMIAHSAVVNRIHWMQKRYPLGPEDVILQKTAFTFDVSVWELFWWSWAGAAVSFLEPDGEKDPEIMIQAIKQHKVTTLHFVPSMLQLFLSHFERSDGSSNIDLKGCLNSLRYVFSSGEALPVPYVERFYQWAASAPGSQVKLINLYGPTEAAIDVSYYDCVTEVDVDSVPIGRPIDNIRLYIVDKENQLLPVGIPGELCISGVGLARGYMNRRELTEEKFVENPFIPGTRMYRTGDLARWLPDGSIEYLGRLDHQIKLRGYRIELGEIEAVLLRQPDIVEAVVLLKEAVDGDKVLYAYLVSEREISAADIRKSLSQALPDYMIPAFYVQVESMPLTANGKADRKALMKLEGHISSRGEYTAPQNEVEARLAVIWQKVLNLESIGSEDNFFVIGGHSLRATQMLHMLHKEFQTNLQLRDIFRFPSIRQLAAAITEQIPSFVEPIPPAADQEYYPLSSAQYRLYIVEQLEGIGTSYHLPIALAYEGPVDVLRLEQALYSLMQRHEILRTSFVSIEGIPMQKIHSDASVTIERMSGKDRTAEEIIQAFIRPFDLSSAPLIRTGIVELSDGKQLVLFDMHHLISDGVSMGILAYELTRLYDRHELQPLQIQYKDFAVWQKQFLASVALKKQQQYWLEQFHDGVPLLNLPTDFRRPLLKDYEGDRVPFRFSPQETEKLKALADEAHATMYMVLLAIFTIVLSRYSGQEDIAVGTPVSARPHADLNGSIGMFVNTIVLRNELSAGYTFKEYLQQVSKRTLEALEHQDYPFEELVTQLKLPRDVSRNPLFDVMFVMQNMDIPELRMGERTLTPFAFHNPTAKLDLTLEVAEAGKELACHFEYGTRLFRKETIDRLIRYFKAVMVEVADNPQILLGEIEMISQQERHQILHQFNDTSYAYPQQRLLHQWMEEQAGIRPDQPALICGNTRLSYRELNEKANQMARYLQQAGLGPNRIAAIAANRSAEMMIGILAILKAGGAYLPIAPDYPLERIHYILEDSGALLLLTQMSADELFAGHNSSDITALPVEKMIDLSSPACYQGENTNLPQTAGAQDLAYVIYTSGSTGKPKGVMIEHHAVANRLLWMQKQYPLGYEDVILQKTAFTFDVSVWELFWWSLAGAAVCFLEPGGEKNPETMIRTMEEHHVSVIHFVPSMLHLFLDYLELIENQQAPRDPLSSLRYVFASGEALAIQHVERFCERFDSSSGHTRLINLYGPTEAAIDVSFYHCEADMQGGSVPIGSPIDNIQLYIVDGADRLQPIGLAGELCIAGTGLARGYINRPDLTAEKFVDNPFVPQTRMYRTGDLAKWLPDGQIEYLGRFDYQVKLRGYRIELGEIEAALMEMEDIAEAVVLVKESGNGDKRLCAYLTGKRELAPAEIRTHLAAKLPDYMIPAYYTHLDAIPLTVNGKADRKALNQFAETYESNREYISPQSDIEVMLAEIWGELLHQERVGTQDNFFDIGGNSLLLLQMHAKLQARLSHPLKVTDLFAYPTIQGLAAFLHSETVAAKQEVWLQYSELPGEFFAKRGELQEGAVLTTHLDVQVSRILASIGKRRQSDLFPVLSSIYLYLLAQLNKKSEQAIQIMLEDGSVHVLSLDLKGIQNVSELIRATVLEFRKMADRGTVHILPRRSAAEPGNGAVVLFYKKNPLVRSNVMSENFDLILSYEVMEERISLTFEFTGRRLRKEPLKQFIQAYGKLANWLANQSIEQDQTAAALEGGTQ